MLLTSIRLSVFLCRLTVLDIVVRSRAAAYRGQRSMRKIHMANGTVKWFNTTKGFGFIAPESGGKDVFVHISALEKAGMTTLSDDQKVTFEVEPGRDGRENATNIALA